MPVMSEPDVQPPSETGSVGDPLEVLATLPRSTQLLLRDYIAGLEAQAGSARALADHHERQRHREVDLLRMKLSGLRRERDEARDERDAALRDLTGLDGPGRPGRAGRR